MADESAMAPTPLERLDLYFDTAAFLAQWRAGDVEAAAAKMAEWSDGAHVFVWSLAHMTPVLIDIARADPTLSHTEVVQQASVVLTDALAAQLQAEGRLTAESWTPPGVQPPPDDENHST